MNNSGNFKFWPDSNLLMSFDNGNVNLNHHLQSPDMNYFSNLPNDSSSLDDLSSFVSTSPLSLDESSIVSLLAQSNQPSPLTNLLNFASPLSKNSSQFSFNNLLNSNSGTGNDSLAMNHQHLLSNSLSNSLSAASASASAASAAVAAVTSGRGKRVTKKKLKDEDEAGRRNDEDDEEDKKRKTGNNATNKSKNDGTEEVKPIKLRQKKKLDEISTDLDDKSDGSIIKRRKKNELQILVENPSHLTNPPTSTTSISNSAAPLSVASSSLLAFTPSTLGTGLLTSVIKNNNLQGYVGSVHNPFHDINSVSNINHISSTPSAASAAAAAAAASSTVSSTSLETPQRKSSRLKNNTLSFSSLSNLSGLDSPFDPSLFTSLDTPSKYKPDTRGDNARGNNFFINTSSDIKFDFDEAVAGHFPSPRAGDYLKGASPSRWCSSTVGASGSNIFNFNDTSVGLSGKIFLSF